jgi:hypothetical protein
LFATWSPHQRDRIAKCNYELGFLLDERADRDAARAAYAAAAATEFGSEARIAKAALSLYDSKYAEAEQAARAIIESARPADPWFARFPSSVDAWLIVARARLATTKPDAALEALRAALDVMADPRINKASARYQRRLAHTRALLAGLLAPRDPRMARELASHALAWSRSAGGYDQRVRELEELTAAR